ncbi:MAG: Protein containing Heat shock protein Hsp20 protein [Parcubacteria group bacterium GW2011_GWC1_45_9]|nr:MAG: Protein containing Heat shock protein Hsp20 protein [Parcubacteria group bacterium GW2011_GWA1_Parcubacteria_45_10]KKT88070.1 MAG: Protein containing Heat shock protein Hsp20 protein [Parcubacteria group bacterium GW2011_GWB1_45_10]KKU16065.1 MAG: Protein containing Heat shock protein Hsp20 protein [Parcubacteria group bacterium GW2011_GWC1_45_9]HCI05438.1 heat-shock protein Hsp20 [Patescibacteria group bacterium]
MLKKNKKQADELAPMPQSDDALGELAIDVFQTPTEIVIQSPIAGVDQENIDVAIENDMITISGKREKQEVVEEKDYFYQECYWGGFSRTVALPTQEVDIEKAKAEMDNGVLTIRIPRVQKMKSKKLKIGTKEKEVEAE